MPHFQDIDKIKRLAQYRGLQLNAVKNGGQLKFISHLILKR